jgi:hypothetical protein
MIVGFGGWLVINCVTIHIHQYRDVNGMYTHDEKEPLIHLKRKQYPTSGDREGLDELVCAQGLHLFSLRVVDQLPSGIGQVLVLARCSRRP